MGYNYFLWTLGLVVRLRPNRRTIIPDYQGVLRWVNGLRGGIAGSSNAGLTTEPLPPPDLHEQGLAGAAQSVIVRVSKLKHRKTGEVEKHDETLVVRPGELLSRSWASVVARQGS